LLVIDLDNSDFIMVVKYAWHH